MIAVTDRSGTRAARVCQVPIGRALPGIEEEVRASVVSRLHLHICIDRYDRSIAVIEMAACTTSLAVLDYVFGFIVYRVPP